MIRDVEREPFPDDVPLEPAVAALDFPVAAPADLALADLGVVGSGWGRSGGPDAPVLWGDVEVADRHALTGDGEPEWQLRTRPRRGIRPAGPPGTGLLVDPDAATLAADAVHSMLSSRVPPGLGAEEVQRRTWDGWQRSQSLREVFSHLPGAGSPWQHRDLVVDGQVFAWWVHEDELGWAGAADLGPVFVQARGTGAAPVSWVLRLLAPVEAAELLALS